MRKFIDLVCINNVLTIGTFMPTTYIVLEPKRNLWFKRWKTCEVSNPYCNGYMFFF